jgi:hypothetical protein
MFGKLISIQMIWARQNATKVGEGRGARPSLEKSASRNVEMVGFPVSEKSASQAQPNRCPQIFLKADLLPNSTNTTTMFQPQKSKGLKAPGIAIRIHTRQLKWAGRPTRRMETVFLDFEGWVSRCLCNLSSKHKSEAAVGSKPNAVV